MKKFLLLNLCFFSLLNFAAIEKSGTAGNEIKTGFLKMLHGASRGVKKAADKVESKLDQKVKKHAKKG